MSYIEDEITEAIKHITSLTYGINRLADKEVENLLDNILNIFVYDRSQRWWWTALKYVEYKEIIETGEGFKYLFQHLPSITQECWFIVDDEDSNTHLVYSIHPYLLPVLLAECSFFEYYIIDKEMSWLLCENHHNQIIFAKKDDISS